MGYRGKLMVEHTGIKLPKEIAEKYKEDYYIAQLDNGDYVVNISSKFETKGHWDILLDLEELLKDNSFGVYGVVLWEDGRIDRHNFPVQLEHESEINAQIRDGIYNKQLLKEGYYIDANCCRPYSKYKDEFY